MMRSSGFTLFYILASLLVVFVAMSSAGPPSQPGAKLTADLKRNVGKRSLEELLKVWDRLPPATEKGIIGTYKGTDLTPQLSGNDTINWYGKRFNSRTSVDPLLARKTPPGSTEPVIYPYPRPNIAQMRTIEFRKKHVASIVYDSSPIMDYFVRIDADTYLGVGDQKGKELGPVFLLERVEPGSVNVLERVEAGARI